MSRTKLPAVVAAMLVLTAFASVPVAARETTESVAVETLSPTDVTDDSATLHGDLTELENASEATVWFEYWEPGDPENASQSPNLTASGVGEFSIDVTDLDGDTTYVAVAHAETEHESAVGDEVEFATRPDETPLGVETHEASEVENRSATLGGELTGLGGQDTATVWFEYWEEGDPGNSSIVGQEEVDGPGAFGAEATALERETTYVYVAHARVDGTTVTGDEVEFATGGSASPGASWNGEGPFGQWLTSWLSNLVPQDTDIPFGQKVAELVTKNNPGADKRSDRANPGGNGNGPPEHAGGGDEGDDGGDGADDS